MVKRLLIIFILLLSTNAYAEKWICSKDETIDERNHLVRREGDCLKLGLCSGFDNTGLNPLCIEATEQEWSDFGQFKKIDNNVVSGSRVVDMTQAEQDSIIAAEQAVATQAEANRQAALDDDVVLDRSSITLTKVDNAIDNIGSLADAKVFLKKLVRYIIDTNSDR